jgi:hypothetical protein
MPLLFIAAFSAGLQKPMVGRQNIQPLNALA